MLSAMARPMPRLDPVITATLSSRRNGVVMSTASRNERAAAGVDGLPGDEAGAGAAQETHDGGDVLRRAALARQRGVDLVVVRLDEVALPRGGNEPGGDTVHRDVVAGEIVRERPGKADETGLGRHHVHAVLRPGMRAQAPDIDD